MDLEDESLTHVRNLVQNFCNKIQLKVISAANTTTTPTPPITPTDTASEGDATATTTEHHQQLAELAFALQSAQLELKLSRDRELQLQKQVKLLQQEFDREYEMRKAAHDELMELRGNIRVFVRQRPMKKSDQQPAVVKLLPATSSVIHLPTERRFEFDACFNDDGNSSSDMFDEQVAPLVVSAMDGRNVTLVAYGQTGSGKTHTMEGGGNGGSGGIYSRSLQRAFAIADARRGREKFHFQVSILQVYNDTLQDLLLPDSSAAAPKLEIHCDERKRVYVKHLSQHAVNTPKQVEALLLLASQRRAVGSHALNEASSRSHLVLMLDVNGRNKMAFIDLAGSERAKDTEATGERFRESQHINKSLSCLGDVLQSMQDKQRTHHPFRNSKLTFLLQDCLSRHSKVAFFACISPEQQCSMDTFCTLAFAERIRKVELGGGGAQAASTATVSPTKKQQQQQDRQ